MSTITVKTGSRGSTFTALLADDLVRDLDEHYDRLVESRKGKSGFEPFSTAENHMAGVMHYLMDTLTDTFGYDKGNLSDEHGFGRMVREHGS